MSVCVCEKFTRLQKNSSSAKLIFNLSHRWLCFLFSVFGAQFSVFWAATTTVTVLSLLTVDAPNHFHLALSLAQAHCCCSFWALVLYIFWVFFYFGFIALCILTVPRKRSEHPNVTCINAAWSLNLFPALGVCKILI